MILLPEIQFKPRASLPVGRSLSLIRETPIWGGGGIHYLYSIDTYCRYFGNFSLQESIPVGCVPPACEPYVGVVPSLRGVPPIAVCHLLGDGGAIPRWAPQEVTSWNPPPPVNRITDRCKNITLPQLRLWAVIIHNS